MNKINWQVGALFFPIIGIGIILIILSIIFMFF
jgi:hypothetical protein